MKCVRQRGEPLKTLSARERHKPNGNRLIAALPSHDRARLAHAMETVALRPHTALAEPQARLRYAYFPHDGVICLMAAMRRGAVETATIGAEGFVGFEALLGGRRASQRVLVQMGGTATRLPIETLLAAAQRSPALQARLLGYVRFLLAQAMQSVACNGLHSVRQRCARWLLMAHDRAGTGTFTLTHQFLAEMLGLQRPSVTLAARELQRTGLIRYSRGMMTILDRKGLERAACECYEIVRRALDETSTRSALRPRG